MFSEPESTTGVGPPEPAFIVIEEVPVIAIDLVASIREAAPNAQIYLVSQIWEAVEALDGGLPIVAVISAKGHNPLTISGLSAAAARADARLVLMQNDDAQDIEELGAWAALPFPFTPEAVHILVMRLLSCYGFDASGQPVPVTP